ncbi:uncharacterized protein [Pyrus communis]|uniref:uncharacterized protein n=1 Tax=Pyrus communis TaxID=23211 RepID=UPI0035C100BB
MSLENEEPHFPDQPTETNHEMQKKSKISYRREFLLSFSELDTCKKLPSGFDQSIISEFEDAFKDRQRTSGLSAYSFRRNEYGSSPPTRGDVAGYSRPIHGRWEGRSTGRSDRDSDSQSDRDSDSGRHFGNQSWRPLQVPEHDGLLGSGSFPRPAGFTAGISAPKVRSNEPYQLNRTNEPYHPPRPYKAAPHSRRDTDSVNDETFGSSELTSEERAEEERKRRASFELMRKEQHKALQEQKLKPEKNKGEFDFATLVDDSKDERRHRSSEVEEPLIPPAANTDSEKSSFLLQTAAPRPLVPPGFATTVLERNLGPKSLSDTREVEVGSSGLEENILRAKTKPVLNGTSDNQVEKQSTEQMILSKQQHGSASIDVPVDGMSEKNQNLSPPQGALNKIIGIESQLYNIANTSQPVEVSRNSEVIDLNAEKVMRTKIVGESNQGPPASILEKLFTSAVALNGVGSSNIAEHQDSKDDETRSSDTAHSSKFARWFHEERKPSDDFSSGRQNDLLSLIVSGEKGGSGITAGKIRDHRFPSFSSQNSEPADRVMNSDVSPTVGSSEQLSKSNKPEAVSTVLTCEDLEQSILSGISENGLTLLPPVQKWSPPGAGGKPEQLKANVDNNASQHLLSLLQKGTGLKDMEPSYNQEKMYFEKLHDTEGATIGNAVRISKNEISENVSDAGKNLTLETLLGTAFMKELKTVGAPVSVKRAPIGSARVDPMQPHSVPFPVTDNSLIPPAIQIVPNSTSHSSSDLTANRRRQTKSDMIEEQWLGLNNPHIELGSSSSQVGTDLGSKIGAFEGHPDFRLPEEDGLIAPSEPLNIQNFMSSGNQVKSKLFSSPNTQVDIVEKLAAMNSAFKDEGSMGSQEVPPFLRSRGPYDMREPDNPYQNLQPPSQQLHHPQLNHVGPPFHPLDPHPGNINSQMSFLGPKGILRSDLPPNHQFHANMLRPPFHHSNTGQSGFDAHTHHPMMQQMRMQGKFPPPHLLQGLTSSPPQHPHPNLGATLPAQPVSQAFVQELNPMQGFPFGPQKPNFGGHGMPLPAPDAAGGSNHHPEALQRLIEMELRSNPKQIHQFPASGHTQGTHGHELDMGFGYR